MWGTTICEGTMFDIIELLNFYSLRAKAGMLMCSDGRKEMVRQVGIARPRRPGGHPGPPDLAAPAHTKRQWPWGETGSVMYSTTNCDMSCSPVAANT